MRPIFLASLACLAACAASSASVREAKKSVYDTEFALVWNAVTELAGKNYSRIVVDDPDQGRLLTDWHLIAQTDSEDTDDRGRVVRGGLFFRMDVRVKSAGGTGGPPWRVVIRAEAAEYKPGFTKIIPFARGAADEPPWVQGRIDNMAARIHERLRPYAVSIEEAVTPAPALDTARWAHLAGDAAQAIAAVHALASVGDVDGLARHMAPTLATELGDDAPADRVRALWKADPGRLEALVRILESDCHRARGQILCESDAGGAVFRPGADGWRLSAFGAE